MNTIIGILFMFVGLSNTFKLPLDLKAINNHRFIKLFSSIPKDDYNDKPFSNKWTLAFTNAKQFRIMNKNELLNKNSQIIETISTKEDYEALVTNERQNIIVLFFFAVWCKSCKHSKPELYKLAKELSGQHSVKFAEISMTKETDSLYRSLNVPSIPYCQMYHPNFGLVEELSVSKKNLKTFKAKLNSYLVCGLDDIDSLDDAEKSS